MNIYELKPYIFNACDFLNISIIDNKNDTYELHFPQDLIEEFNGTKITITFDKDCAIPDTTYITFEAFLTQKIARLVSEFNDGVSSGSKTFSLNDTKVILQNKFTSCSVTYEKLDEFQNDYLLIWFKTTLNGNTVEEYLKGFKYNFQTRSISFIEDSYVEQLDSINEGIIKGYSNDLIKDVYNEVEIIAKKDAENFIVNKELELQDQLQKEVDRINEYYNILETENSKAETSKGASATEELKLLKKEKERLIEQQKKKYISEAPVVTLEPIAVILLRENIEKAVANINNNYGATSIQLVATKSPEVKCEITNDTGGPFTLTSDNQIVLESQSFSCSQCNQLKTINKQNKCGECNSDVCSGCTYQSDISGTFLCKNHQQTCQSCLRVAASSEFHKCDECNQYYCTVCNKTNKCNLCNSLKPLKGLTPDVEKVLIENNLVAQRYEVAKQGNIIVILGKKLLFKSFLVTYNHKTNQTMEIIQYGLFNKKR